MLATSSVVAAPLEVGVVGRAVPGNTTNSVTTFSDPDVQVYLPWSSTPSPVTSRLDMILGMEFPLREISWFEPGVSLIMYFEDGVNGSQTMKL